MYFQLKTVSSIAEVLTLGHLNAFSLHYFEPKGDGYEAYTSEVTIKFLDTVCYVISLLHLIDLLVQFFSQTILLKRGTDFVVLMKIKFCLKAV